MASLSIRNLEDSVIERLKTRADENGRSLEAEVRQILATAAKPALKESYERVTEFRNKTWGDRIFFRFL